MAVTESGSSGRAGGALSAEPSLQPSVFTFLSHVDKILALGCNSFSCLSKINSNTRFKLFFFQFHIKFKAIIQIHQCKAMYVNLSII